jgi:hypothetical protein
LKGKGNNREGETMKNTIAWQTTAGQATITVTLQTEETVNCDGDKAIVPCCHLYTVVELDGRYMGTSVDRLSKPIPCGEGLAVARCGRLGISDVNYERYLAAVAALKATPEWMAHEAIIKRNEAEMAKYYEAKDRIDRIMSE